MPFGTDRNQLRRYFCEVWRKLDSGQPLEPLERIIAQVIGQHPEYHALLADPETALERDYPIEGGEINPFLHLGMHIAIQEQLVSNRPMGILEIYKILCQHCGDSHAAEHQMMEALGETLWEAQKNGAVPDEGHYVQKLRRLARRS